MMRSRLRFSLHPESILIYHRVRFIEQILARRSKAGTDHPTANSGETYQAQNPDANKESHQLFSAVVPRRT